MSGWRRCSACKEDIGFNQNYYICSVSTCQQKKTDYAFCSLDCWDQHLPIERHRDGSAGALERKSPAPEPRESRRVVVSAGGSREATFSKPATRSEMEDEILVVASKVKKYISDRSRMNTSATALDALSDRIRQLCDQAIQAAREDSRKTIMDRDIPKI